MFDLAIRTTRLHRLLKGVRKPWARYLERRDLHRFSALGQRLFERLAGEGQADFSGIPHITHAVKTRSDVIVLLMANPLSGEVSRVLKLPLSPGAEQSTAAHRQVLIALHQAPGLDRFRDLIPRPVGWGEFEGQVYYIETALQGVAASDLVRRRAEPASLLRDAARAIGLLHRATARREVVGEALFGRLAGDDLALLCQLAERWPEAKLLTRRLDELGGLLRGALLGRELPFAWAHGDYWPGNILIRPETGALGGIVDWDRASAEQLPLLDTLHLLAYTRKMRQGTELGQEIVTYLLPAAFSAEERALIDEAAAQLDLPGGAEFLRAAAWLYWLRFAAVNLSRYPSFQRDRYWMRENVIFVLKRGLL